jgi:hypothetical protein
MGMNAKLFKIAQYAETMKSLGLMFSIENGNDLSIIPHLIKIAQYAETA